MVIEIVDLPIENVDFPYSYVSLPEGIWSLIETNLCGFLSRLSCENGSSSVCFNPGLSGIWIGYGGKKGIGNPKKNDIHWYTMIYLCIIMYNHVYWKWTSSRNGCSSSHCPRWSLGLTLMECILMRYPYLGDLDHLGIAAMEWTALAGSS